MKKSYELIEKIIKDHGMSQYAVTKALGLPVNMFWIWKNKGIVPKYNRLRKITTFLSTEEHPLTPEDFYKQDLEENDNG